MQRRTFIGKAGIAVGTALASTSVIVENQTRKPVLRVAHITDVHIRPEENVPARAVDWLEKVKKHQLDFFLNGRDSIHDASDDGVSRERTLEQWKVWDQFRKAMSEFEVYSCIGNHDPWWDVPSEEDEMYGKPYVVNRLGIHSTYYSFNKGNWHFIVLDGNHEGISLGLEQMEWLANDLNSLALGTPTLVMSHFPITSITGALVGGQHKDQKELNALFYKHQDKVKVCLSVHQHLLDRA